MAKKERTAEEAAAKAARKAEKASKKAGKSVDAPSAATLEDKLDSHSPLAHVTATLYLALSPVVNNYPLEGACAEHLSPLLLQYQHKFGGVVLSYDNARLSEGPDDALRLDGPSDVLARSINEYGVGFVWLTADFLIFRPSPGTYIKAEVNLQNEGIFGLIHLNYFTVSVPKENLPVDWRWEGERWVNAQGEAEKEVVCKVEDFEPSGEGSISITGTLLGL
ncbi:Putative RNA polymerase Rpb7-like domain superfamily, RPA43, OB domain-containing protein [Septoria linicola]|uniref:DNA-directed RNA polymerase subunit n=1 Tax=Septoria linicola TaxID=215465 RepID=A0A9Q9ANL9_9PEZI|nr:putative RNA polymerase Rpb7-like domain superfamily, RPA43, OB domain-containing protein [Septoria linicola]USW49266.1 Putative RNA polymerase Rpb7-like domain superfamily, RPA43, OB domain-containing protein [Septoria linicola]